MKIRHLLAASVLSAGALASHAATLTLADYAVRIDGSTAFPTRGEALPAGVSVTSFDAATGLGGIAILIRTPGAHSVGVFMDHDIDQATNTFFNEFGAKSGSPAVGQSWEIDEPGYRSGNLYTNFVSGQLDNSNSVPSLAVDDVAMAQGENFTLGPNETALIWVTLGQSVPTNGFYLTQTDPYSQRTIYFAGSLSLQSEDTAPPIIACPGNITASADAGYCFKSIVTFSATAIDNSPGVLVACAPASGSRFNVGTTSVRCVATDIVGTTNSCTFNVLIRPEAPVIQCPANIIAECAPPGGRTVTFSVTASSPCDPNLTVGCVPPSGSLFPVGASVVNCAAVDSTGGRSECGFSVFLVSTSTNCPGSYSLLKETCLAGEVHAFPLLQPYPCGMCVEVTGVPADGWAFMGWLGDARGRAQTTHLTMSQNKCVEAVFGTQITVASAANGTAWLDPATSLYPCGSQVRALARPDAGYYFVHWTNGLTGPVNPTDITVANTNVVLMPIFLPLTPDQFSVTVETRGFGTVRS